jgi:hypothetical protein
MNIRPSLYVNSPIDSGRNRYTYCLEELELGINMFSLAIKHVVSVFFPLMMEDKHLITLSEEYILP